MTLQAGNLRHRVTFEAPPATLDGRGNVTGNWQQIATVWAAVEQVSGGEATAARKQIATANLRVSVRAQRQLDSLTPKHRLRWGARLLWISSIDRSRIDEITIECGELVG